MEQAIELVSKSAMSALIDEKAKLSKEKNELAGAISGIGLSVNRLKFAPHTIDQESLDLRSAYVKRYTEIEKRLLEIKNITRAKKPDDRHFIKGILVESLGKDFAYAVFDEAERRANEEDYLKVSPPMGKPATRSYRKELTEAIELLRSARETITQWIYANEPDVNKADWLAKVAKLNKCIPPISELNQLRPK